MISPNLYLSALNYCSDMGEGAGLAVLKVFVTDICIGLEIWSSSMRDAATGPLGENCTRHLESYVAQLATYGLSVRIRRS